MDEKQSRPKVAVTGASGLVGGHVVEYLAKGGYSMVAVVRSPESARQLTKFLDDMKGSIDVRLAQAAVSDAKALAEAFSGCDVVVHAAGSVNPYGSRQDIFATNVDGTKNVLAAAEKANVKHFIFISSLSVITGQGDQFNLDESAPLRPCGESYADSKIEAEKAVMASSGRLKVTSLRPGFIYGPGERSWMPRLITNIRNGKAMLIDGGKRETNVIYVGNLCRAVEKTLLNPKSFGQVYNLTDGQSISKKQLFDAIADGLSLPRVTKSVPRPVAQLACTVVSGIAPMLSSQTQQKMSRFSRAAFRLAAVNQGFSIAKAQRDLGYTDRILFHEGMARTLESFRVSAGESHDSRTELSSMRQE
jgi:nucleoside-diphosphate-sugar epimerase